MMDVSRRGFFQRASGATVISIGAMAAPVVLGQRPKKVSQDELSEAIVNHRAWLEDQGKGTRTVFNNRDLSGLHFTSGDGSMVNLRGADFTGSDMTGVTGKDVSFLRASLHDARLSWSHFELVTFSNASLRRSKCDNVVWGWDAASQNSPNPVDPASERIDVISGYVGTVRLFEQHGFEVEAIRSCKAPISVPSVGW